MAESLDATDWAILGEVQRDGRIPLTELGRRVNLSASATTERVKRLEATGVVTGYRAVVDLEKVGCAVLAVVRLKYAGSSHSPLRVRRIAQSAPHARPAVRHSVGASIGRRVAADTRSGDKPYGHPAGWMSFPTPTEGNPARWIPG
jgi:DNA-binding Lrp family transcriptional regulator